MKLYLNPINRKKPKEPIYNFIKRYFELGSKSTYYDKECNNLHCSRGKNRSIDDMLNIVKTEYPKSSNKAIYKAFKKFLLFEEQKQQTKKVFIFCKDVEKWVFFTYVPDYNIRFLWNYGDSINKRDKKGKGKETFNSFLIGKLGFTKKELKKENTNS
jgi:hypothetical protein